MTTPEQDAAGADVIEQVRTAVTRYVVLPSKEAEVAVALWIVASHAADKLHTAPRLAIRSPEKRCGKSRLLDLVTTLSRNGLPTANVSSAVVYRVMGGENKPTLVIDEADTIWGSKKTAEQNEDLRGLVNAGFERGRPTLRYDAAARRVEQLETFGFVALAGIGQLPDTITDRAVNITMRRRMVGEQVAPFRSRRDGPPLQKLRDRVDRWVAANASRIGSMEPELPVEDRAADVWEPLVIIADVAGGDWPALAREAAQVLTSEQEQEDGGSSSARLLADIRDIFAEQRTDFIASSELVTALRKREESPWLEWELTTRKLADKLRHYKVSPQRNVTGTLRGYRLESLAEVFDRYLTRQEASSRQTPSSEAGSDLTSDTSKCQASNGAGGLTSGSDTLTLLDGLPLDPGQPPPDTSDATGQLPPEEQPRVTVPDYLPDDWADQIGEPPTEWD